jgi:hypothetical protein
MAWLGEAWLPTRQRPRGSPAGPLARVRLLAPGLGEVRRELLASAEAAPRSCSASSRINLLATAARRTRAADMLAELLDAWAALVQPPNTT